MATIGGEFTAVKEAGEEEKALDADPSRFEACPAVGDRRVASREARALPHLREVLESARPVHSV